MQTITITPQLENGRFYIDVPEYLVESDFTIQIIVKKTKTESSPVQERLAKVKSFAGIASNSKFTIDKTEWYHQ